MAASNKQGSKKSRKVKDTGAEKEKKDFQWIDDKAEIPLNVTWEYKVMKAANFVD